MAGSIKEAFQMMGKTGMPGIVVGVIEKISPISITLKDDPKIILSDVSLIIPKRITGRKKCLQNCYDINENGCKDCCVPEPMKVGEELYMLALNDNKLYYVLDWK